MREQQIMNNEEFDKKIESLRTALRIETDLDKAVAIEREINELKDGVPNLTDSK